jgi:hypothetical protein
VSYNYNGSNFDNNGCPFIYILLCFILIRKKIKLWYIATIRKLWYNATIKKILQQIQIRMIRDRGRRALAPSVFDGYL